MTDNELKYLLNIIRESHVRSEGRAEALRRARKKVKIGIIKTGPNKGKPKFKLFWKCAACIEWFREVKAMEVDHIEEIGPYKGDLHDYAHRIFCGQDNLQVLCVTCHLRKTNLFANARSRWKRK